MNIALEIRSAWDRFMLRTIRRGSIAQIALAAWIFLSADAALAQERRDPSHYVSALWSVKPMELTPDTSSKTGSVGFVLFEQSFRSSDVAILTDGASLSIPGQFRWDRSPGEVVFEPGATLLKLTNIGDSAIYCAPTTSWRSPKALDGRRLRACLYDREPDGVFDNIFWMGVTDVNNFGGMFLYRDGRRQGAVSARYSAQSESDMPIFKAGPLITRSALNAYRVTFAIRNGPGAVILGDMSGAGESRAGDQTEAHDARTVYFRQQDVPLIIDLIGARIEISAINGDQVSYKILSGFDGTRPIAIGFNRDLPPHVGPYTEVPN